jgi:nephrocystin-3
MSGDDLTITQKEALRDAWLCLTTNETAKTDTILASLPRNLAPARNLRGVSVLRQGDIRSALKIFGSLVVPKDAVTMDVSCPVAWQANFVVALLLSGNLDGFLAHVHRIQPEDHPVARRLREAVSHWKERLSGWGKWRWKIFGGSPPVPLELNFTVGWADDFLTPDDEPGGKSAADGLVFRSPEKPGTGDAQGEIAFPARAAPGRATPPGVAAPLAVARPSTLPTPSSAPGMLPDEALKFSRMIRVFISSTFRDMVDERNELMTHVYPELRKICRERGVEFVEVDLRWGITEEQSRRRETLRLCLNEIKLCRPFFIGLLGERYGWVPGEDTFTGDLCEEEPWIEKLQDRSVTELEIVHGVLNNPEMARQAFFYFRDPAYARERGADFLSDDPASTSRQEDLKERISTVSSERNIPIRKNYPAPEALAALVLKDLSEAIYQELPKEKKPDPLTWDALDHEAFAGSRRKTYIGRDDYFRQLDAYAAGDGGSTGLMVLGESGGGKSALLANWTAHWRRLHPEDFIFQHYIGATPQSAGHLGLIRRLITEIQRWCRDPAQETAGEKLFQLAREAIPSDSAELGRTFPSWLAKASVRAQEKRVRFVIVLDALNQLEDVENSRLLGWLPIRISLGVPLVVSTLPGDTLDALRPRQWETLRVEPLDEDERRRLVVDYLARFGRTLEEGRVKHIATAPATANALYLKALLDDLRVTGNHEDLDEHISNHLEARDIPALYRKLLSRFEHDYEQDRPGLVREALSLIWAARRGLTEPELLELLRPHGTERLPAAIWARLRFGLEESLVERSGILNFSHDYLRQAVADQFIEDDATVCSLRLRLAAYFEKKDKDSRRADELPWLLMQAAEWDLLRACLLDIDQFLILIERGMSELLGYWLKLGEERQMGDYYLEAFDEWAGSLQRKNGQPADWETAYAANQLGCFLNHAGLYDTAQPLIRRALVNSERVLGPEHPSTLTSVNNLAVLLETKGDYAQAEPLYRRALEGYEGMFGPEHPDTLKSVNNLAVLLATKGDYAQAEPLYRRALESSERVLGPEHPETLPSVNNLAALLEAKGDYAQAEPLYRRAQEGYERMLGPEHPDTLASVNNLAVLLETKGDYAQAEPLYRRTLEGYERMLGPEHPDTLMNVNNLAVLLKSKGDYAQAEPLYRRALEGYERMLGPEHPSTLTSVNNLAALLEAKGDYAQAEPLYRRALECRERLLGPEHPSTITSVNILAGFLYRKGEHGEAEPLYRRALESSERLLGPGHPSTITSVNILAVLLEIKGDYAQAEPLYRRALESSERVLGPEDPETLPSVKNLARLLYRKGEYGGAEPLDRRVLEAQERLLGPEHPDTLMSVNNLAALLEAKGDYAQAEPLYRRALLGLLAISHAMGREHPHLQTCFGNYADCLEKIGLTEAEIDAKINEIRG